ncbi:hypothetical protein LTR08_008692 [Meristemomyces frigidus]|nr:hypothetical protein LTR08_008692 [Meristemomyces frigidus]
MARGKGAGYLSYTALVLLSTIPPISALTDLWAVHIDNGPAPSPEDGPPFSAHATRDRALLPYQIAGVVGSYVATVVVVGTLLLTVGRKLRRRAQDMAARPTEMVKPMGRAFDPSPISPLSSSGRSWYSPRKLRSKKSASGSVRSGVSNLVSPGLASVVSFDANVIESDRQQRQEEMERLYAAVVAQDERKSQTAIITTSEVPVAAPPTSPPRYSARRAPPRLVTDAPALRHLQVNSGQWSPRSPTTPKSPVRAIYPPDSPMPPMPSSPAGPIRAEYPTTPLSPHFADQLPPRTSDLRPVRDTRTSSYGSSRSFASTSTTVAGTGRKARKSLRHLKIGAPIQSAGDDNSDGARTPLSPRFYTDPGIPPEPPTARTLDSQYAPTTPGAASTRSFGQYAAPNTPGGASTRSWRYGETDDEQMDEVRDLPLAHPNRASAYVYNDPAQGVTDLASSRPADPIAPTTAAASNPNRPLPLRQLAQQQQEHQHQHHQQHPHPTFPLSPTHWPHPHPHHQPHLLSPPPVKTTFLSSRAHERLGGPRTGLATPYSPYMPFTPLTPVTPHLLGRAERRQRMREERRGRGAIVEEEAVRGEGEIWGDGYA